MTDERAREAAQEVSATPTLDGLVRLTALRRPEAIALTDPPNRAHFTAGSPRVLTYAALDRAVAAVEAQLRELGMPAGSVIGLHMPNTAESIVTMLGVMHAGLTPALVPLRWGRAEAGRALSRVGALALIVCGHVSGTDYADLALHVAADTFTIRYVCGFGDRLPDGIVSIDHIWSAASQPAATENRASPEDPALITFDDTDADLRPVYRSHGQLLAGGLAVVLEAELPRHAAILSTLLPSSFGTIAASIVPWALTGGTLALHHPFDSATFAAQLASGDFDAVSVPGLLLDAFTEPDGASAATRVVALWRTPEQQALSPATSAGVKTTDILAFNETGVLALARDANGAPRPLPHGAIHHPSRAPAGASAIATDISPRGTLTLAGPMVSPAGTPVDTGFACRLSGASIILDAVQSPALADQPQPAPAA